MNQPDAEQKTLWQLRSRLELVESERKALADSVRDYAEQAKQNTERARRAHLRVDELLAMNAELIQRVETLEANLLKLRDWTMAKLNGKGNGHVADSKADGERMGA